MKTSSPPKKKRETHGPPLLHGWLSPPTKKKKAPKIRRPKCKTTKNRALPQSEGLCPSPCSPVIMFLFNRDFFLFTVFVDGRVVVAQQHSRKPPRCCTARRSTVDPFSPLPSVARPPCNEEDDDGKLISFNILFLVHRVVLPFRFVVVSKDLAHG